ncbi:MAG: hypothetical protein RSB41_01145 [Bacilli bacterium]
MKNIESEELKCIEGGFSLSGTLINSFSKAINTLFELGRTFGSALRRMRSRNMCRF